MTTPPREVTVRCQRCGTVFQDWYRASVNLAVEGWDENDPDVQAYLEECSTATCPECGLRQPVADVLVVDWEDDPT
jgi:hypothetical protein